MLVSTNHWGQPRCLSNAEAWLPAQRKPHTREGSLVGRANVKMMTICKMSKKGHSHLITHSCERKENLLQVLHFPPNMVAICCFVLHKCNTSSPLVQTTNHRYSWGSSLSSCSTSSTCRWPADQGKLLPSDPTVVTTVRMMCTTHLLLRV